MDEVALLPVVPVLALALLVLLAVGLGVPPRGGYEPGEVRPVPTAPTGGSPAGSRVGGALALLAAVGVVLLARQGGSTTSNGGSLLAVGVGLPLLLVIPLLLSPLLSRAAAGGEPVADVRPALLPALGLAALVVLPASPGEPELVATAVGGWALVVLALAVAGGPVQRVEVLGLLGRWAALGPRLVAWAPPRGAPAVVAVVLAAVVAERVERTGSWQEAARGRGASALLLVALLAAALLLAALLARWTPPGTAAAVLVPLLVGAVAGCLARRALISAQLLADLALPGRSGVAVDPFGIAGGQALAAGLVVLGAAASLAVLARRCGPEGARVRGAALLLAASLAVCWVVLQR